MDANMIALIDNLSLIALIIACPVSLFCAIGLGLISSDRFNWPGKYKKGE